MDIAVDIDGTLFEDATSDGIFDAAPIPEAVRFVNELYEQGHIVTLYTARGMRRLGGRAHLIPERYYEPTVAQLQAAKLRYHHLVFGKLPFDLLIDDRAVTMTDLLSGRRSLGAAVPKG